MTLMTETLTDAEAGILQFPSNVATPSYFYLHLHNTGTVKHSAFQATTS